MKYAMMLVLASVVSASAAAPAKKGADGMEGGRQSSAAGHSHGISRSGHGNQVTLRDGMRKLWADHMQWTYATVNAFYHNEKALQPTLARLLRNQKDIGGAVASYYGKTAGDRLTALLTTHIQQSVPVLTAARAGDKPALDKALADWYANAEEIALFLSAANPKRWPESATKPMMKGHIDTTVAYAVDLLKDDYEGAIKHYDGAYDHMMMLADVLTDGIVAQFPDKS